MKAAIALLSLALVATAPSNAVPASYAQVKAAVRAVRMQLPPLPADDVFADSRYGLDDCGGTDYTGGDASAASVYSAIADRALTWQADLPRLGYPRSVWSTAVARFEATATDDARDVVSKAAFARWYDRIDARRRSLQKVLVAYRTAHPKAVPTDEDGVGCGDAEAAVKFVTQPAATQVSIIPSFFYELCRVQRIDPDDTSRCPHWREVSGPIVQVSGYYHYIARWRDGTVKRGMLDADSAWTSGTFTLRKP